MNVTERRQRLITNLAEDTPLICLAGNVAVQSAGDMAFAFKQEANFFYLTGIREPGWGLIIDGATGDQYLLAPTVSEAHELFDGSLSWDDAKRVSGVSQVISWNESDAFFEKLSTQHDTAFTLGKHPYQEWFDFALNPAQAELAKKLEKHFDTVEDCRPALSKMRAIKSADEIEAIKRAVAVSIEGFEKLKQALPSARYEYELEAVLNSEFRRQGSEGHAYDAIVAAGKNACTLHYVKNNDELEQGALVLIDAATVVDGYAADITRTYAVGEVSDRHKAVHKAVQTAHEKIIALIHPGLSLKEYQQKVDGIMEEALTNLHLLKNPEDHRKYFPHAISHGLGIDVHDSLGGFTEFMPGMVLTVEPGIYIPEEAIGVRIEDDILVTETGHENLSGALPTNL